MRRVSVFIFLIGLVVTVFGQEVKVGDSFEDSIYSLRYVVTGLSPNTVGVASTYTYYEEPIAIPDIVTYKGEDFTVTEILENGFKYNSFESDFLLSNTLERIGANAFTECEGIKELELPASVKEIDPTAFREMHDITKITVAEGNSCYASIDGILYNFDKTELLYCPEQYYNDECTIPGGVTSIADYAFYMCKSPVKVFIPEGVVSIGDFAFSSSWVYEFTFPESLEYVGEQALWCSWFWGYPESGPVYAGNVFYDWTDRGAQEVVTIREGCVSISPGALSDSYNIIKQVNIPSTVKRLGFTGMPFYNFELRRIIQSYEVSPDNPYMTSENGVIFDKERKTLPLMPNGKKGSYTIPAGVTAIGDCAFYNTFLDTVVVSEGVESIGNRAFFHSWRLYTMYLPATIQHIGEEAFSSQWFFDNVGYERQNYAPKKTVCNGCGVPDVFDAEPHVFRNLYCSAKIPPAAIKKTFDCTRFYEMMYNDYYPETWPVLHVPANSIEAYRQAPGWDVFENVIAIDWECDANGDGDVNAGDVAAVYEALITIPADYSGKTYQQDVNFNGVVNTEDISLIYRKMMDL